MITQMKLIQIVAGTSISLVLSIVVFITCFNDPLPIPERALTSSVINFNSISFTSITSSTAVPIEQQSTSSFMTNSCVVFNVEINDKKQNVIQGEGIMLKDGKPIDCADREFVWFHQNGSLKLCYAYNIVDYILSNSNIEKLDPSSSCGSSFTTSPFDCNGVPYGRSDCFGRHTYFYDNGVIEKSWFDKARLKHLSLGVTCIGSQTFYKSGALQSCRSLCEDSVIDAIPCSRDQGSIHFYENGSLKSCALSESHNFYGYELPQFTQIWLFDDHSLESFYANTPISIQDIPCGVGFVFLHPNGNLKSCLLETSQVIQTVSYEAGDEVCFDSEGVAVDCS